MKITLISHASLLVETADMTILTDPSLFDPWGRINVSHPRREIDLQRLPRPDLLILSHDHLDHCDPRSIAVLDTDTPVLRPPSPRLAKELDQLGFTNQRELSVSASSKVKTGSTEIHTTISDVVGIEFGMLFSDSDGVVWNQVDSNVTERTYSAITPFPKVHVLFFPWQPFLQENLATGSSFDFPLEDYQKLLNVAARVDADLNVPGACGFRYPDTHQWLNHCMFPVPAERVPEDFSRFSNRKCERLLPGDVILLKKGRCRVTRQGSPFVRTVEDNPARVAFRPYTEIPSMVRTDTSSSKDVERIMDYFNKRGEVPVPSTLRRWKPRYQVQVLFSTERILLDLEIRGEKGRFRLAPQDGSPEVVTQIWGPSLASLLRGEALFEELLFLGDVRTGGACYEINSRVRGQMPRNVSLFWLEQNIADRAFDNFVAEARKATKIRPKKKSERQPTPSR